ncbi:MAG TPA: YheV family putative zinc ribbon protein [Pseudomonadales bacterium]|nr:YheV family putative zinc ribbon protein [Pseudomonadales bacterium]
MSVLPDIPRRFIAGARCTQCQALDKVVMYRKDGQQYRECVACGYVDAMQFEQNFRELETRVNRTEAEKRDAVAVVRLVDPDVASDM